jgi:hypothetical protein
MSTFHGISAKSFAIYRLFWVGGVNCIIYELYAGG